MGETLSKQTSKNIWAKDWKYPQKSMTVLIATDKVFRLFGGSFAQTPHRLNGGSEENRLYNKVRLRFDRA